MREGIQLPMHFRSLDPMETQECMCLQWDGRMASNLQRALQAFKEESLLSWVGSTVHVVNSNRVQILGKIRLD